MRSATAKANSSRKINWLCLRNSGRPASRKKSSRKQELPRRRVIRIRPKRQRRSEAGDSRWHGIWCGNGSCTIWRKPTSTAPAAATDREEHGRSQLAGAGDCIQVRRSSTAAPAGKDLRAAGREYLAQDDGRLVAIGGRTARSSVSGVKEVAV